MPSKVHLSPFVSYIFGQIRFFSPPSIISLIFVCLDGAVCILQTSLFAQPLSLYCATGIWRHISMFTDECMHSRRVSAHPALCTCVYRAGQGNSVLWLQQSGGVWSAVTCVWGGDASTTGLSLGQASWLSASSLSSLAQTQTSWQSFSADALTSSLPPPPYPPPCTRLRAAPLIIQPLVRVISTLADSQLMSSFNITSDWTTHTYTQRETVPLLFLPDW